MGLPVSHVVSALAAEKWVQVILTFLVILGYIITSSVKADPAVVSTLGNFSLISFGYWFGQVGSGLAVAQKVESATVQKVIAQKVKSDYGE